MMTKLTAMNDLPSLSRPRTEGKKIDGTAVVAGGSVSGLMAARVCSNHFSRVLVVEPEEWTTTEDGLSDDSRDHITEDNKKPNPRSRVMQYISLHAYQAFSYMAMKAMFPAFDEEAAKIDPQAVGPCDMNAYIGGRILRAPYKAYKGILPRFIAISRPAYETLVRKLVNKYCDNVEFVNGTVTGIQIDVDGPSQGLEGAGVGDRIQSVTIKTKDGLETKEPTLLLVDCTGPTCAGLKWVSSIDKPLNIPKPSYDPKVYYTTAEFHVDPKSMENVAIPGGWKNARAIYNYLPDSRMDRRTLLCMKREDNTLQFAAGGFDVPAKPRSISDLRIFFRSLKGIDPVPDFMYRMLDVLEKTGADQKATYSDARVPPCYYVKYHEVSDKMPSNFVALGDSVMRVNPVRGQGCTKATIGVATLSGILDYCNPVFHSNSSREVLPDQFAKIFWERQHNRIGSVWDQTRAEDYGWDTTTTADGETREYGSLTRWYTWNLLAVGRKNPKIANAIYGSAMFLAPGTDVLTPGIVARVCLAGLKDYLGITKYGA